MSMINGIAAANGIAIAKAYELTEPNLSFERKTIEDFEQEISRFQEALQASLKELKMIQKRVEQTLDQDHAAIFSAHMLVLEDPDFINEIKRMVTEEKINIEAALHDVAHSFINTFEKLKDPYMRERTVDIKDVTKRVMSHLLGKPLPTPALINEEVIIIADDLTPSDTAQLNRQYIKGFVTNIGGRTSHTAIMARSLEIPAVVGTKDITEKATPGDLIIIDGTEGKVIVNPSENLVEHYRHQQHLYEQQQAQWRQLKDLPTLTKDHEQVKLSANIGNPNDVESVLKYGGEGIGLYRTEFLYMGQQSLPSEDVQFEAYKIVLEKMDGKPVVVRTLDIGGDKELDYLELPKEMNPFLGVRAIRFCLENEEIFRPQLRALLRASVYGQLKIMFPMIATLEEFRAAKRILLEEKDNLIREGVPVSNHIEVGIMVEIPSTAIIANQFAKEVDFFSIGTNDLIQYTMAADRMNEHVAYLYEPYHPAILKLIHYVIDAAHAEGKRVSMCGEMAGDPIAIPILLSLGLDEFSMSASSILQARHQISQLTKKNLTSYKDSILSMRTADEVVTFIKEEVGKVDS